MSMQNEVLLNSVKQSLANNYLIDIPEANVVQLHSAIGDAVMSQAAESWRAARRAHEKVRRAYYLSAEYLVGRMVFNNLYCLGILDSMREQFIKQGVDLACLEEIEDQALGNGGLGRLAACFLDSAATCDIPVDGYGLRYKFGLFKQAFKDGFQIEQADDWQRQHDPWSRRRDDKAVQVVFGDQTVLAVPYDMPIFGYQTDNVSTLRLWQSEPIEEFDFKLFNDQEYDLAVREKNSVEDITRVLYPNDSTLEGKKLRLKQQYFLSSASIQDIVRRYKRVRGSDFSGFAAHCAIQLNDTHPTISIPELIRVLMAEGESFDSAFVLAADTFSYTNHTIMPEALECWDTSLFEAVAPQVWEVVKLIDARLASELKHKGVDGDQMLKMAIIGDGKVRMANLATYVSTYVNGVAQLHTEILKERVLNDWYELYPDKFQNKTNGVSQRRWLGLCNQELTALISERIGEGFIKDFSQISRLKARIDDDLINRFNAVKLEKKRQLSKLISEREGVELDPSFIFDVQVKRLHEYKRQLLFAFSIMDIYFMLKDGSLTDFVPMAFIFGAKAAPGYMRAKAIIKYINEIAAMINADPDVNQKLRVVFVSNYNCSYAEKIMPAADISEQISTAGTEASGTGNMKLMINGTVTLGTYDGANIEIVNEAGEENNYIFGARVEEIQRMRDTYDPTALYASNPRIKRVVDTLIDGTFSDGNTGAFKELYNSLLKGAHWHTPDNYFLLYDLLPYTQAKLKVNSDYKDRLEFGRKCLMNTACSAKFSSDRTIKEYASQLWNVPTLK